MSGDEGSTCLFQLLESRARKRPDAVLYYRDNQAVSNREAHDDALALAAGLRFRFMAAPPSMAAPQIAETTVLAAMFNDPYELHRLVWASRAAGCCLAFLPMISDPDQVRALMRQVEAGHLFTDVPALLGQDFAFSVAEIGCADKLAAADGSVVGPAFLLQTSGTTGIGKWVAVQDRQFMTMLEAMQETGALRHAEDQVAFLTPPLSHSYGLSTLLEYVHAESAVVFPRGTSPLGPAGELRQRELAERITAIEGVPYFYDQLSRLLRRLRLPALRHVGFGGGQLAGEALTRLRQTFPGLTYSVRYGMTETPSVVSGMVFRPPYEDDWSSSGAVLPVWELRIVDEVGRLLPDGQEGEIQLRGPCLAWPYYGEPKIEGAFFATGDTGSLQGDQLSIRGRKSLFIKHGGYRFSPEDVETVIRRFEGVSDVRVYMDDLGKMSDGVLTAELVSEDEELPRQALRTFAADRLPAYAVPQRLLRVAKIPRTDSGKIKRGPGSRKP